MIQPQSLEELASLAAAGDRAALNALLNQVQHPMYRLSLRFLGHPADAQDATQEILIRLTTHLSTFEGRSSFTTWAYTIATRMLLRTRKRAVESSVVSAERFAEFLDAGLADRDFPAEAAEFRELIEEVRIRCTYGMLLSLTRPMRAAYLLGDVLGLTDQEGAEISGITPAAFRQRLSRSRRTLRSIIDGRCGLVDSSNPCRCERQIAASLDAGIMERSDKTFCRHPTMANLPGAGTALVSISQNLHSQNLRPKNDSSISLISDIQASPTDSKRPVTSKLESHGIDAEAFNKAADQIDRIVAIGSLYQRDRFAAPSEIWSQLQRAMPELLDA
jgi:RNA polymerase sigma factor (sigma-70 family)